MTLSEWCRWQAQPAGAAGGPSRWTQTAARLPLPMILSGDVPEMTSPTHGTNSIALPVCFPALTGSTSTRYREELSFMEPRSDFLEAVPDNRQGTWRWDPRHSKMGTMQAALAISATAMDARFMSGSLSPLVRIFYAQGARRRQRQSCRRASGSGYFATRCAIANRLPSVTRASFDNADLVVHILSRLHDDLRINVSVARDDRHSTTIFGRGVLDGQRRKDQDGFHTSSSVGPNERAPHITLRRALPQVASGSEPRAPIRQGRKA